jgi:hypothetical protein
VGTGMVFASDTVMEVMTKINHADLAKNAEKTYIIGAKGSKRSLSSFEKNSSISLKRFQFVNN